MLQKNTISFEKEPHIEMCTRTIYRNVLKIGFVADLFFAAVFIVLGHTNMACIVALLACLNAVALISSLPIYGMVLIGHTQLIFISCYAVVSLGWQYGAQLLLFIGIALNFFGSYHSRTLLLLPPICEVLLYCYLLINYADKPIIFVLPAHIVDFIHCSLVLFVAILMLYTTQRTDIAILIYKKQLATFTHHLNTLANRDELTGLYNRHAMQNILQRSWHSHTNYNKHFFLVMCDIDYFKNLNDSYGHISGDLILKQLAEILHTKFRETDYVARWGGDEFLILLSDINCPLEAKSLVERVRLAIEETDFAITDNSSVKLNMTFGCAGAGNHKSLESVLTAADAQLYLGKQGGRNTVCIEE